VWKPETINLPKKLEHLRAVLKVPADESPTDVLDEVMCVARLAESLQSTEQ
jgi:hypothetical protein